MTHFRVTGQPRNRRPHRTQRALVDEQSGPPDAALWRDGTNRAARRSAILGLLG
jgi:hypothetical protein